MRGSANALARATAESNWQARGTNIAAAVAFVRQRPPFALDGDETEPPVPYPSSIREPLELRRAQDRFTSFFPHAGRRQQSTVRFEEQTPEFPAASASPRGHTEAPQGVASLIAGAVPDTAGQRPPEGFFFTTNGELQRLPPSHATRTRRSLVDGVVFGGDLRDPNPREVEASFTVSSRKRHVLSHPHGLGEMLRWDDSSSVAPASSAVSIPVAQAFNFFDTNRSGYLDASEVLSALRLYGVDATADMARNLVRRYDENVRDGRLDMQEFAGLVRDLERAAAPGPRATWLQPEPMVKSPVRASQGSSPLRYDTAERVWVTQDGSVSHRDPITGSPPQQQQQHHHHHHQEHAPSWAGTGSWSARPGRMSLAQGLGLGFTNPYAQGLAHGPPIR